jgi:hypothetical protein
MLKRGMSHRFKVGDLVRIDKAEGRNAAEVLANLGRRAPLPEGLFEVVRQLPALDTGDFQYRVKAAAGGQERVVREGQISPAKR